MLLESVSVVEKEKEVMALRAIKDLSEAIYFSKRLQPNSLSLKHFSPFNLGRSRLFLLSFVLNHRKIYHLRLIVKLFKLYCLKIITSGLSSLNNVKRSSK